MFDLGALGEFLIILIAVLVLFGPKELPQALRILGRITGKIRAVSQEARKSVEALITEAEIQDYTEKAQRTAQSSQASSSDFPPPSQSKSTLKTPNTPVQNPVKPVQSLNPSRYETPVNPPQSPKKSLKGKTLSGVPKRKSPQNLGENSGKHSGETL